MKKLLNLFMTLLLPAALCLPAFAQDEGDAPSEETGAEAPAKPAAKPAAKKTAPKKKPAAKKKKKKAPKPVSEYKFTSAEAIPTYKFDKKANPIIKPAKKKKKKTSAKAASKKPAEESSKYIEDESATKPLEEGQ